MEPKDHPKYEEIEHLLLTEMDESVIFEYIEKQQWIRCVDNIYILDLNTLYIDLIYGKYNRLSNEFLYEYVFLERDQVIDTLKYILSHIETISTNRFIFPIHKISTKSPPTKQINQIFDVDSIQKEELESTLKEIYDEYEHETKKKKNSISQFLVKLNEYRDGLIDKKDLLKNLVFKDGIYYKNGLPVLQQSEIENMINLDEGEEQLEIEVQIYVSSVLYDYFSFITLNEQEEARLIKNIENIVNDMITPEQNRGEIDYYVRLSFLAIYKNQISDYDVVYDLETYQKMLVFTERETLKFRQEHNTKISIDIGEIANMWWEKIKDLLPRESEEDSDDEEDIYELDEENMIAKQKKTMD